MISGDIELFPGVELKMFKGHTPGCLAMILHLENDTYIFPSDTVPRRENYEDPVNNIHFTCTDVEEFRKAVAELKKLEKEYDAKLIFPHDDGPVEVQKPFFIR